MSELEALNLLLRLIGSSPVVSKTTNHPDAVNARATLDRLRQRAQRRGWWFNIDYNVTYTPDARGEIRIPDEITSFVAVCNSYVQRGKRLYNKVDQTYLFPTSVVAKRTVRVLDWDDMPDSMQEYCAYKAGASLVRDELEDSEKRRELEDDAREVYAELTSKDLQEGQYNMFSNNKIAISRAGVRPYGRSRILFDS